MSFKLGNTDINKIYLGDTEIKKAYLGATLVYDKTAVPNGLLNNLVSYYKMDTNGSFPDAHGSNNGTINGATFTTNGKINGGYNFDGVNDYVNTPAGSWGNNFSYSIWVKTTETTQRLMLDNDTPGTSNNRTFLAINRNSSGIQETGWITIFGDNGPLNSEYGANVGINDGDWHNIIYTRGLTTKLYFDGVEINGSGTVPSGNITGTRLAIGAVFGGAIPFNGTLDELGIWGRELTQIDATNIYNSGAGLSYDNFTT